MAVKRRKKIIAVLGGAVCDSSIAFIAERVGEEIAKRDGILICGGRSGVMEASCRGAKNSGGFTIGVLPDLDKKSSNNYLDVILPTGMGNARNIIIVSSADAAVAIDGSYGTLSEIAICLKLGVPVIGITTWDVDSNIIKADDPVEAVEKAFQSARND